LDSLVKPGDWVIDIGANVGHYTKRFSELVGPRGRVIAFEPVPNTFALLAANVVLLPVANVSLLNLAASNTTTVLNVRIPSFDTGLRNYYRASVTNEATELQVMTIALDSLHLSNPIHLVKIDTEGHESQVIHGMTALLQRDRPILIVETCSEDIIGYLESTFMYRSERLPDSPNILFKVAENHMRCPSQGVRSQV
jgi:FkbM family methyltransferase